MLRTKSPDKTKFDLIFSNCLTHKKLRQHEAVTKNAYFVLNKFLMRNRKVKKYPGKILLHSESKVRENAYCTYFSFSSHDLKQSHMAVKEASCKVCSLSAADFLHIF